MAGIIYELKRGYKTYKKMKYIMKNTSHSEMFSKNEIVGGIVNLYQAKQYLSSLEFSYIQMIFDRLEMDDTQKRMTHKQYIAWYGEIISHFDIIAPYYKFCGNTKVEALLETSDEYKNKNPFRVKAKKLMESKMLFSEDWNILNNNFYKEFYE